MVSGENVLYFAAPLFGAYRDHDYWAYRAVALNALRDFLPQPMLRFSGPGWVEATMHSQQSSDDHPERRIVHLVSYHPRRTTQPIQHVDQSWDVSGLSVEVLSDGTPVERVYVALEGEALPFGTKDGYTWVPLPPIGAHTVVVLE